MGLLVALYALELSLLLVLLTAYVFSYKPTATSFLMSWPGYLFAFGVVTFVASVAAVAYRYFQYGRFNDRGFKITVAMNVASVLCLTVVGEGIVRAASRATPTGDVVGSNYLLPREWNKVAAHFQEQLRNAKDTASYHVFHDVLGWTIAPNRRSEGLYYSSVEGLRSPSIGTKFSERRPATRIALIGDSYAFGEEVEFEDMWGYQLEVLLGSDVQVLNFGVMGYGIDQAYLRYLKDVRAWNPDIVVFEVIDHDLVRMMGVYSFLTFPEASVPFATPRFTLKDHTLTLLNVPLPKPEEIFSARSIHELPFVQWDPQYVRMEWDRPFWYVPTRSYLFRWLATWYPLREEEPSPAVSNPTLRLIAREIFRSFVKEVHANKGIPILAYLPTLRHEWETPNYTPLTLQILDDAGIGYTDLRNCLSTVPFKERHMPRLHYSPKGNYAVASCLAQMVADQTSS